eukprot:COSAG04_NODE_3677_length_2611_cov_1.453025_1_plen_402_part_00
MMLMPLLAALLLLCGSLVAASGADSGADGSGTDSGGGTGWADCTGTAPDARSVQRAWRRMALTSHPDKTNGGSAESFEDMTALRDSLKDPDKFQIHKLLRNLTDLRPFGESAPQARVTGARVQVRQQCADVLDPSTCFPYAALTADFALSRALPPGAAYTFALGAEGISTIQYHGDDRAAAGAGGYDVCCDFLVDSACVRRPASTLPAVGPGAAEGEAAAAAGEESPTPEPGWGESTGGPDWLKLYEAHDCPVADVFSASVSRPLHVMAAGRWAVTMSIRDREGTELACVGAAFEVAEADLKRAEESSGQPTDGGAGDDTGQQTQQDGHESDATAGGGAGGKSEQGAPEPEGLVGPTSFEFLERGVYCEDGIDILEGSLDECATPPTAPSSALDSQSRGPI